MAPYRGRGRSTNGRGAIRGTGRLARKGIKTRNGYKRFDSQRVRDVHESESEGERPSPAEEIVSEEGSLSEEESPEESNPTVKAYSALLESFQRTSPPNERKAKRKRIEEVPEQSTVVEEEDLALDDGGSGEEDESQWYERDSEEEGSHNEDGDASGSMNDPCEVHFTVLNDKKLSQSIKAVQNSDWKIEKRVIDRSLTFTTFSPNGATDNFTPHLRKAISSKLPIKARLAKYAQKHMISGTDFGRIILPHLFNYTDLLIGNRTTRNADDFRNLVCLHAVNHVLKGRDRVLKNNERLRNAADNPDLEFRDQGFVRPKILILLETRQIAAKYAGSVVDVFEPEQQENRKRFNDSFTSSIEDRQTMPEDYRELFDGNNDNSFMTALKFTRKTIKIYSPFYNSDIILASPLGLRGIIENEDAKKRDHDFLSSIELVIVDQADAMQMQSWENIEVVFKHLNLDLKEAHGCDFSRVRQWYLEGNARYMRQTIVSSAYITPEMNSLFNSGMQNVAGKAKLALQYAGTINDTSGLGIKQTFSRFSSMSPSSDPDTRFKYFTTAMVPTMLRLPKPADGAQGILIFIPSYFDFLRIRNFFATSTQTQNVSFGTIHDYTEVSDQRRARSHFLSGRHSILLYTQRAHHFFRLKIRGVKKVFMYGLPDNPIFYQELVEGFLGTSIGEGKAEPTETSVRSAFSKWDVLKLERIVGGERVKGMLGGLGDTFDFY